MPVYTYYCRQCEESFDEYRQIGDRDTPATCPNCGEPAYRDFLGSMQPARMADQWDKPLLSEAAGVDPSQIAAQKRRFPHHEFTPDGRMVFHNRGHMKRCLSDIGMADYDDYR